MASSVLCSSPARYVSRSSWRGGDERQLQPRDANAELTDAGSGAHPAWDGGADALMPVPVTISFAR
jgi:hypothetical protein